MKKSYAILLHSAVATVLGIILTFAFAPYEVFPLAILAPAGLLALWLKVAPSTGHAFRLGFLFGLGFFGSGIYWVFTSIHVFGGVPTLLALVITAGFISFLALIPGSVGYFLNRYFPLQTTAKLVFAFPAIWVMSEWVRSWIFTGFPWLLLGYSQTNSPLKGYAPVLSVYIISLALTMSSALIVNAVFKYQQKAFKSLYLNLLSLAMIWIAGGLLSLIPWTIPQGEPITVSLVQGNIPQSIKWSPEHLQLSLDRYTDLTQPLWGKSNIIIWPEASVPLPLQNAEDFINALDDKAKESGSALILGIPIRTLDGKSYYNSVVTLGADKGVYSKRHLVPFGEYTPMEALLSNALKFMDIPMSEMRAGDYHQPPLTVGNTKISASICYEIAFPEVIRSLDKSTGLLLVVTNDAWFGESNAEPQHLQMAAMRALESGKPVLFVSNDGITAIINPKGQIEAAIPQREATVLNGKVQPMYGTTPWLFNGIDPVLFIALVFIFISVRANKIAASITTPGKSNSKKPQQTKTLDHK